MTNAGDRTYFPSSGSTTYHPSRFETCTREGAAPAVLPCDIIARKERSRPRVQKNGDTKRLSHRTRRPIFRLSERILSLSLCRSLPSCPLHDLLLHLIPLPPLRVSLARAQADGSLHFALALLLQVPGPLRARARARVNERARERGVLQCPATPGIVTGIVIIIATVAGCGRVANGKAEGR